MPDPALPTYPNDPMIDPTPDYIPSWLAPVLGAVFGAGGLKMLSVWLENRRLTRKDYRETMLDRIRELEKIVGRLQVRIGNLRVEVAHLETENQVLREAAGLPPSTLPEIPDVDEPLAGASDES